MIDLFNKESVEFVLKKIEEEQGRIDINRRLFDIYEEHIGQLLRDKLKADLSESSFNQCKERVCPINILKRYDDKVSKIYQQEPVREVFDGSNGDKDKEIVAEFEKLLNLDHKLNINNELYNIFYYTLLHIGFDMDSRKPFVRTIPNDQFIVINCSEVDPTSDDVVVLFMDDQVDEMGNKIKIYHVYTDILFAIYGSDGEIKYELMASLGQDGFNPFRKKPFVYLNKSDNLVMPKVQEDTLDISLLIPLLITDTNYIAKFSAFSIMYGIDVDNKEMKIAPNTFWGFKSSPESDKKPELGTITPKGDIDVLIKNAISQLSLWLDTKGIKAGSVGSMDASNIASGISKIIDEADISDYREHQTTLYAMFEQRLWDLLLNYIYPFWKEQSLVPDYGTFSVDATVIPYFKPQTPAMSRGQQVADLKLEVESGFMSRRQAIIELNPRLSDEEIDYIIAEIESENKSQAQQVIVADNEEDNEEGKEDANEEQDGNENKNIS
jgi:hypothetical protein